MDNIHKNREDTINVLRRAYKLLTDKSITNLNSPDKLRRTRLFLPKPCTIDGVLKDHSRVLSSMRKERLRNLLNVSSTIPSPHYTLGDQKIKFKKILLSKTHRSDETLYGNTKVDLGYEPDEKEGITEFLPKSKLRKPKTRSFPNIFKEPNLATIEEEITYDGCDLYFYVDLVCNCMDILIPFTKIDKNLKQYRNSNCNTDHDNNNQ